MYTCTYVQILQLKGKLSNIDVTQNQFCAIDDQDIPLLDLNNSFKRWNLTVTGVTIKSYQITSIVVISPWE